MIQAILFDVDGVLLDSFEANFEFFQRLLTKAGYTPFSKEIYKQKYFYMPMFEIIKQETNSSEQEVKRIAKIAEESSLYPLELVKRPADALPTLELLYPKYSLGLVTSRLKSGIELVPQLAELKKFFKVIIAYEDTVEHKPEPEPLLLAAERLGVNPSEAVYVGDAETDFQSAKAAGMKIIMYKNQDIKNADGYISSFSELPNNLDI